MKIMVKAFAINQCFILTYLKLDNATDKAYNDTKLSYLIFFLFFLSLKNKCLFFPYLSANYCPIIIVVSNVS